MTGNRRQSKKQFPRKSIGSETFERIDLPCKEAVDTTGKAKDNLQVAKAVYVKKVPFEEGCRVLCYSEGREQKERAINALTLFVSCSALECKSKLLIKI